MNTKKMETKKTVKVQTTNKKKPNGLIKAAGIVGLVYLIVDIISWVTFILIGILALAKKIPIPQGTTYTTYGITSLILSCVVLVSAILALKSFTNNKKGIIDNKALAITNIIFNIALGILTVIIFNKKQAGEI